MATLPGYDYEHLFIDNASTDGTVAILRELAAADKRVKVIVNTRNFGHIRSPYHAFLQARGDAVMGCVADLQDPPELIPEFVAQVGGGLQGRHRREAGQRGVLAHGPRRARLYYWLVAKLSSDVELVQNFTGFGLYDREVVEQFRAHGRAVPVLPGARLRLRLRARGDRLRAAGARRGARPRTTSSPSTTSRCWASPTTPRCRCASRRWPGSPLSILALVVALGLPGPQAGLVGHLQPRAGAARHRRLLLRRGAAVLHRHARRVHRLDPHPGPQAAAGGREGADQLRRAS